ncbi:MAG: hypothetical protein R3F23_04845 [Verrucomicrobiia bacterium]
MHEGSVFNLKRYAHHDLSVEKWYSEKGENPYWILDAVEVKTAWHPIGV